MFGVRVSTEYSGAQQTPHSEVFGPQIGPSTESLPVCAPGLPLTSASSRLLSPYSCQRRFRILFLAICFSSLSLLPLNPTPAFSAWLPDLSYCQPCLRA
ncbi:hypothetical protein LMH87_003656 [Akanthomyces muscarius]|uniref:Uncharacterized protein n=1 Tax=Akanthomyces muscarius TaxID=2231603 RepID=A0A9W8Q1U3_AKAMU|nr:hypothetical protein LMH87_003656 [Akanthomyces muscarius]KAJ4144786.1 hypothetical protein LMH87_003656 [Akanthomyces muscarius]